MWFFYIMSILPLIAGAVLWYYDKHLCWWQWLAGFGLALLTAIIFHVLVFYGMTEDVETFSGCITQTTHYPEWVERYTTTETTTDSKGHTHTHTETHYRTHYECWDAESNIGSSQTISFQQYADIKWRLGNQIETERPYKSGFYSGDPCTYVTRNRSGYCYPIHETHHWVNRVKATPSLFSFPPVPKKSPVFDYPENDNWFVSHRLFGTAENINQLQFDQMMARLGPTKHVNLIIVGFPMGTDSEIGHLQQAKWIGGKKNDVVICYAGNGKAEWVYTFGWTDSELCKANLNTIFLNHPVNTSILPLVESEIQANYVIKDWTKFDYLSPEPPTWSYFVYFIVMLGSQIEFWIAADRANVGRQHTRFGDF